MEILSNLFANAGRYLLLIRVTDLLDIAILAYLIYHLLGLVRNTKATSLLKGVGVFLVVLLLSDVLKLHAINYLLKHMVEWGVLALIIKALWGMYKKCPKSAVSYIVMAAAFILAAFVDVSVLPILIGCALFGLVSTVVMERKAKK